MNVGILGAGSIAKCMAAAINGLDDSVKAYAVASRDINKAQAFADEWGFEEAYGSYEDMLNDPKVDLVYVATPHSYHLEHSKLCIDHGKAVLCEKPFTVNAAQARELFDYAREKNVFITEAIWTRYMPSRSILNETIASGIIGTPRMIVADLSYPIENKNRMTDPNLAGGSLLDIGIYPINFTSMVFGNDIRDISGSCTYTDTGVDCQDSITITYNDGRVAILSSSMQVATHRLGMIFGTGGYVHCTNVNNIEKIEVFNVDHELIKEVPIPNQINGYEYEILACKKALEEGALECSEMPHSETLKMMEWMDKLRNDWGIKYPFE